MSPKTHNYVEEGRGWCSKCGAAIGDMSHNPDWTTKVYKDLLARASRAEKTAVEAQERILEMQHSSKRGREGR